MSTEDERKLFVAGLPDSMTEDALRQLFEATGGQVVNVTLPKHRDTGRPRGFGFVTLATSEQAGTARGELDGSIQAGRAISVRPFQSEPPRRDSPRSGGDRDGAPMSSGGNAGDRTLYVGNLPYDASQADLEQLFTSSGVTPVVRIHLPIGPDGRMRGFGFVTMGSAEAANQAIVALRGVEMKGRPLMVNIAHPRGERPAGGGGAGGYDRAPPSRRTFDGPQSGGFGGGGFADFGPPPQAASAEGGRGGGDRRGGGGGGGGGGGPAGPDYDSAKKKKKKRAKLDAGNKPGRDNRKRWQDWDED